MIKVFVSLVAACLALAAQAQTQFPPFSPRPITIVLAFPPGASADGLMRLVTQKITDQTGQSFVIRNTPGGSGTVAAATVKRAPPDGLTLLQATLTTMATNQRLADEPQYDLVKDFKAVTKLWSLPLLAIVPTSGGVKSMRELVELARRKPGGASYSSTGVHTVPHFLGALLAVESGAPMFHVPYSGASTAIVDLVAGRLDLYFVSYAAVVSQVEAGHLRALAVADSARLTALPDLPTAAEAGYPSVSLQSHWGLLAPAGTPDDSVTRLNELFTRALRDPEIRRFMASQGTEAAATTPKEFGDMVASEFISLERILNATGMGKK